MSSGRYRGVWWCDLAFTMDALLMVILARGEVGEVILGPLAEDGF